MTKTKLSPLKNSGLFKFFSNFSKRKDDEIIFALSLCYKNANYLARVARKNEKELLFVLHEFEVVSSGRTYPEEVAHEFLSGKTICHTFSKKLWRIVLIKQILLELKTHILDLDFFCDEIKKGWTLKIGSEKQNRKTYSSALLYGVVQKNPNATKIILSLGTTPQKILEDFIFELNEIYDRTEWLIDLIFDYN